MSSEFDEHAYKRINRRKTTVCTVGGLKIGGDHPIRVQTMLNTLTTDIKSSVQQIRDCVTAGAEIIRISVPDSESSAALKEIIHIIKSEQIGYDTLGCVVPIIADIHFHYKRGIEACESGASCTRINPGNIGTVDRAREIVKACKDYGSSIRIGVNSGSIDTRILDKYKSPCPEALVESALESVKTLEDIGFYNFKISVKASDVMMMIKAYELLALKCDYPFHLGVTEAGPAFSGTIKSAIGLGSLLTRGIGDTIRISLSAPPQDEPRVGWEVLKSLGIRTRGVNIISCPSCARQQFDVINVVSEIEKATAHITKPIKISMLGCVVNGLGEAKESDIGITGAGSGNHLIYLYGEPHEKATSEDLVEKILKIIREKLIA